MATLCAVTTALEAVGIGRWGAQFPVAQVLASPAEELTVSGDDARIRITHGTLRADHVLELVRTDGLFVGLAFPKGRTTTRRKPLPDLSAEMLNPRVRG